MKVTWTKGLEGDARKDIEAAFKANILLRSRLIEMLGDKEKSSLKARTKNEDYDSPNWAYKQADAVGYTRAVQEIIALLRD